MAKILIVEDSPEERDLFAAMLETAGRHEIKTAASGESALRMIAEEHVDLLLTDFVLPGLDGLQLVNRAIDLDPGLRGKILVITGAMFGREEALEFALGATVMTKPVTIDALLKAVDKVLAGETPRKDS